MHTLKFAALCIITLYGVVIVILFLLQRKMIFFPGKLPPDFVFLQEGAREVFLKTSDGVTINALFFRKSLPEVVLYFHGNAGDLSGWQFAADDFTRLGYSFMIIDYRGYGKSTGSISEEGFYRDADAAVAFLRDEGFRESDMLIYGRSVGTGVAVDLAARTTCKGLLLESPYVSLGKLADEKMPLMFPSLYLRFRFDNKEKINAVKCPVVFIHGEKDLLIPPAHTDLLFAAFRGKKKKLLVPRAGHNDVSGMPEYSHFLSATLPSFFD